MSADPTVAALLDLQDAADAVILASEAGREDDALRGAIRLNALAHGEVAETLLRAGMPPLSIGALRAGTTTVAGLAARSGPALAVAATANRVREFVAQQSAELNDSALSGVLRLSYLEEEVLLRSRVGERAAAKAAAGQATAAWQRLRRELAAGDPCLVERFDRHIERLTEAESAWHMQQEARQGIELCSEAQALLGRWQTPGRTQHRMPRAS